MGWMDDVKTAVTQELRSTGVDGIAQRVMSKEFRDIPVIAMSGCATWQECLSKRKLALAIPGTEMTLTLTGGGQTSTWASVLVYAAGFNVESVPYSFSSGGVLYQSYLQMSAIVKLTKAQGGQGNGSGVTGEARPL
jgi:hypothetical protein